MCVCVSHGYKRKIFWRVRVQESEITAEFKIENLHRLSIMQVRLLVSKDLTARVNSLFNQRFDIRLKWLEYLKHLFIGEFFIAIRFESCVCVLCRCDFLFPQSATFHQFGFVGGEMLIVFLCAFIVSNSKLKH